MATRSKRTCTYPGCGVATSGPRCEKHPYKRRDNRGGSTKRGYDGAWQKLRNAFIKAHPLCRRCVQRGITRPGTQVDHIKPFQGKNDPLRLDPSNLQTLCTTCHNRKTAAQRGS